ncbi:MAG: hypothetical protein WCO77_09135 [bacterium]
MKNRNPESGPQGYDEKVMARLKSVAPVKVSHDLAPEILAKVRLGRTERTPFRQFVIPLAAAAAVALLLGGLWMTGEKPADPGTQAIAWLCQTQEPDGSWSTARWGGDKHFEVALTGLSLMTLLDESERWTPTSGRRQWLDKLPDSLNRARRSRSTEEINRAVESAIAYLLRCQQADGQIGASFSGSPYNQGIATLALAKAYGVRKDEALRIALDRAISVICANQYRDGGWGYQNEAHPASNLSITLWQVEALRLASLQDRGQLRPAIERGLRWMAGVAADDGSFGYQARGDTPGGASQTLTAMGAMSLLDPAHIGLVSPGRRQAIKAQMQRLAASPGPDMDYYRRYFLAAALKKMDETTARQDLSSLRHALLAHQVRQGADAGSWNPDDRWASTGGRIYSTAMASLSLR